jgi:hypothetical protein
MQAAKFIPPGSIRLGTFAPVGTYATAFKRPDGKIVILVQNEGAKKNLSIDNLNIELAAESVLTIVL